MDRCIQSLTNQTYKNLQIILVDDGSCDKSGEICDEWAKTDARITVIHQLNGGVGKARNTGLNVATGKYIAFVDSDDYVAENIYELLVGTAEKNHAQQVCCNLYNVFVTGIVEEKHYFQNRVIVTSQHVFGELILSLLNPKEANNKARLLQSPCNKLYLKEVIDKYNVKFDTSLPYAEDWLFNVNYYRFTDCVVFIPEHLYYYDRTTESSLSKTFRWEGFDNSVRIRRIEKEWFPELCTDETFYNLVLKIHIHYLKLYTRYNGYAGFKKYTEFLYSNQSLSEAYQSNCSVPSGHGMAQICFQRTNSKIYAFLYYIWASFLVSNSATKHYIKKILKIIKK